jgi:hypothetical protein
VKPQAYRELLQDGVWRLADSLKIPVLKIQTITKFNLFVRKNNLFGIERKIRSSINQSAIAPHAKFEYD